ANLEAARLQLTADLLRQRPSAATPRAFAREVDGPSPLEGQPQTGSRTAQNSPCARAEKIEIGPRSGVAGPAARGVWPKLPSRPAASRERPRRVGDPVSAICGTNCAAPLMVSGR